jgi:hypothetical protein
MSFKWSSKVISMLTITIYVLVVNFNKLDTVKSQGVQLRSQFTYTYNINEHMRFVAAVYFYINELFPKVDPSFPKELVDFSAEQKEKLYKFLCGNVRMFVHDEFLNDTVGIQAYTTETYFDFKCRVMPWTNDKIRINFLTGVGGIKTIGKRVDSRDYGYKKPIRG